MQNTPNTRSQKRKSNKNNTEEKENINKKYKKDKDFSDNSDGESEHDYDYSPSSNTEDEDDTSTSDTISLSEYNFITNSNKNIIENEKYITELNNTLQDTECIQLDEYNEEENTVNTQISYSIKDVSNNTDQCPECIPINEYNLRKNTSYSESLTPEEKKYMEETEKAIYELNRHKIPPRHKILLSQMSLSSKSKVIENMNIIETMNSYSSEYSKLSRWIDGILQVPFGKYYELPITLTSPNEEIISYLSNIENMMDECIYGQQKAKEKILEFVGKWITNPKSTNEPLAFIGDKGTGKTTLAKEGIAKALGRPFHIISLGGESDSSSFKGHDYTYEGSRWGKIVDILISSKCMNPVIFFDELDKISTTCEGDEITGMLMHLTDTIQNDCFTDKYFSGINFDLSKVMFIFSYNDPEKLNPILRDRLTEVNFTSFKKKEKLIIAKNFLIKRVCRNIGLKEENYIFNDDTLTYLIEKYTDDKEAGIRSVKRMIEAIFLRLNLFHLPQNLNISYKNIKIKKKEDKYFISTDIITELLKDSIPSIPDSIFSMYC